MILYTYIDQDGALIQLASNWRIKLHDQCEKGNRIRNISQFVVIYYVRDERTVPTHTKFTKKLAQLFFTHIYTYWHTSESKKIHLFSPKASYKGVLLFWNECGTIYQPFIIHTVKVGMWRSRSLLPLWTFLDQAIHLVVSSYWIFKF